MSWNQDLSRKFSGRNELGLAQLLQEFDLPDEIEKEDLERVLAVFRAEYGLTIGLLRASDPLSWFVSPPRTHNPLKWFFDRAAMEDGASELNYQLKKCRKALGGTNPSSPPSTLREYAIACLIPEIGPDK